MPGAGLAYDKPSRLSQVMIVCFSTAVVLMAGWLVLMFMQSREGTSAENTSARDVEIATTRTPSGEGVQPAVSRFPSTVRGAQPDDPVAWSNAPAALAATSGDGTTPTSEPWPAPVLPSAAAAPYATSSLATPQSEPSYRDVPAESLTAPSAGAVEATEPVPLPSPRPRHVAGIPVPRPRPHIDDPPETQAAQDQRTLFDLMIERQK